MTIPLWIFSIILLIIHFGFSLYCVGFLFYILTTNKLGVFSENPILWSILIFIGGPISFLIFKSFIYEMFLFKNYNVFFKSDKWQFPKIIKSDTQECHFTTLSSIWELNGGIRWQMFNNWKRFL